jgi:hypothetical protein
LAARSRRAQAAPAKPPQPVTAYPTTPEQTSRHKGSAMITPDSKSNKMRVCLK